MNTNLIAAGVAVALATLVLGPLTQRAKVLERVTHGSPEYDAKVRLSSMLDQQGYVAWHAEHNLHKAELLFRRSLELDPGYPTTVYALAQVLEAEGTSNDALLAYRELVHPTSSWRGSEQSNSDVLMHYAELCDKAGQKDEARDALRRVVENAMRLTGSVSLGDSFPSVSLPENPSNSEIRSVAFVVIGLSAMKHGDLVNANASFDRALHSNPQLAAANYYKGYNFLLHQQPAKAREAFELAAKGHEPDVKQAAKSAMQRLQ